MLTWKRDASAYRTLKLSKFRRKGRTEAEAFDAAIREANDKDHVVVFVRRWYMTRVNDWQAHPHGVTIRQGARAVSLNGVEPRRYPYEELAVRDHPDEGRVLKNSLPELADSRFFHGAFLLNGRTLYCGPYSDWKPHRHGILLKIDKEFRVVVAKKFDPDSVVC